MNEEGQGERTPLSTMDSESGTSGGQESVVGQGHSLLTGDSASFSEGRVNSFGLKIPQIARNSVRKHLRKYNNPGNTSRFKINQHVISNSYALLPG
jgi:hypothetical protein